MQRPPRTWLQVTPVNERHTCADHEPELSALLDGQLAEPAAARLRAHLVDCPGCLAELEGIRRARSLLRSLPVRAVPAGLFTQSAVEGLYVSPPPRRIQRSAMGLRPLLVAMLVAAVVVVTAVFALGGIDSQSALVAVDVPRLVAHHLDAADDRGEVVPMASERLVLEWPGGPAEPATVSRSAVVSAPQPDVEGPTVLSDKYEVAVGSTEQIMDRRCVRLDVRIATTGELREQVWIDDASGVFLRRETYSSGERARTVAYLSLDLDGPSPQATSTPGPITVSSPAQLGALRTAGWSLPTELARGYTLEATSVHSSTPGMPLQAIYSDGLYTVSLFVQPGQPDLSALPTDMAQVAELTDRRAYAMSGLPAGIVWGSEHHTLTMLGDAPRDDLLAIATALPADRPTSPSARFGRGMRRVIDASRATISATTVDP